MPSKPIPLTPAFLALTSVFLAGLGQFFLAQPDKPWTLFPGLLLDAAALRLCASGFLTFTPSHLSTPGKRTLSPIVEWGLFVLILLTAFFFRFYRLDLVPMGLHTDEGLIGQSALRILRDGWRPFARVFDYQVPELLLFYQMAAWFGAVGSSYFTFHLFFVLLSLAAFPLAYWTFRQWAGPRTALLSLFVLAVMRWNWVETRNGYPSLQVPFYLFGALAFWTLGLKGGKKWAWYLSALFAGAGFYGYQAFKIVPPLLALYAAYEFLSRKRKERPLRPFLAYFLVVFLLILPRLGVMVKDGTLGQREADLFLGSKIASEHSLKPLWDVWAGTALMFNRKGDGNARHNVPGRRMLDDVTAVFFVLGLGLAWRRRREPGGFYPLAGFGALSLAGLLSTDPAQSNRLVCLTPFVAYFAGCALDLAWQSAASGRKKPWVPAVLLGLLLAGMTAQNAYVYFVTQAGDPRCREAFGLEQNLIGRNIESACRAFPGQDRYFVTPLYFRNHTVDFLAASARPALAEFDLWDWAAGKVPSDRTAVVFVEGEKTGVAAFLKTLFPAMGLIPYADELGRTRMDFCVIPEKSLKAARSWRRGLTGRYWEGGGRSGRPLTVRLDPLLNFTSKFDFPFTRYPPFRILWTGTLVAPESGDYRFQFLTTDSARLWLDGKEVGPGNPRRLSAGPHGLRLDFRKDSGDTLALTLIWKKPGDGKWEVVPATAFGRAAP